MKAVFFGDWDNEQMKNMLKEFSRQIALNLKDIEQARKSSVICLPVMNLACHQKLVINEGQFFGYIDPTYLVLN